MGLVFDTPKNSISFQKVNRVMHRNIYEIFETWEPGINETGLS